MNASDHTASRAFMLASVGALCALTTVAIQPTAWKAVSIAAMLVVLLRLQLLLDKALRQAEHQDAIARDQQSAARVEWYQRAFVDAEADRARGGPGLAPDIGGSSMQALERTTHPARGRDGQEASP